MRMVGASSVPSAFGNLLQTLLVSLDHLLDHLAADGTGFTGGQVTIVTLLQIHADFLGSLHFETVHCLTGLGDVDLVVVLGTHIHSLLLVSLERPMLSEETIFLSATIF